MDKSSGNGERGGSVGGTLDRVKVTLTVDDQTEKRSLKFRALGLIDEHQRDLMSPRQFFQLVQLMILEASFGQMAADHFK